MTSARRRFTWAAGLTLTFLALVLVSAVVLHGRGERSFERLIDDLRSAGEPVTLDDVRADPIPDEANGVVALEAPLEEHERAGENWVPPSGWTAEGASADALEVREAIDRLLQDEELSEAQLFGLRAWLEERSGWLTDLTAACRRDGWVATKSEPYPSLSVLFIFGAAQLQSARAILAARDGSSEEAVLHTRDLFHFATALDSQPCWSQLMGWMAMQGMALSAGEAVLRIGGEDLDISSWLPFIDAADVRTRFLTAIRAERAFLIDVATGQGELSGLVPVGTRGFLGRALDSFGLPSHLRDTLQRRGELIDAVIAAPDLASVPLPARPAPSRWNPNPFEFDIGSRMSDLVALEGRMAALGWR